MRRATVVLGLLVCGLLAACVWLWRELDEERALSSTLRARLDTVQKLATARTAVETAPALAATLPAAAPATSPASPATGVTAPAPQHVTGTQEEWNAYRRRMMNDPRYREAQREQNRLSLALRRANLIRLLGLTPEQADAVIDLQIDHEWQREEFMTDVANEEQRQQRQQRAEAQDAELRTKLQTMLGQEKTARLERYMETRQSRMQVDNFRGQLSATNMLRDDQVEPLIEALHAERSKMRQELQDYRDTLNWDGQATETWRSYGERQTELMKTMHAGMHSAAMSILSASQLQELDATLERELQRHMAQQRMQQIQSKIDRANPAASPN
jgi:hypothetical protein